MAGKIKKNPFAFQDKYLIAEQSGMVVLVSGLLIAFFIGLVVRAAVAPTRVKAMIENAAQTIHKDVQVTFQDAEVSLSDGILPRFAVVISNVVMSSTQECWMQPQLTVDQLRLPVSLYGLLSGRGALEQIQADNVNVQLLGEYKDCRKQLSEASNPHDSISEPPRLVSLQENSSSSTQGKYANRIESVTIEKLQIGAERYPNYKISLHDLGFRIKNFESRWMVLNAKTQLFPDQQIGDYFSHANIHIEYKESPEATLQAHFFGNWREGYYSLVGNYSPADESFVLETELKHIPFSQILSLMQKYDPVDPKLNARQLWLSFQSRYMGDISQIAHSPFEVTNLLVDGEQIEIGADKITFRTLNPLTYDPIHLNIQKIGVDKILSFFNHTLSTRMFASLGVFSGTAEIRSAQDIRLQGSHNGLEFIFANKGQRELQSILRMRTSAEFKNDNWKIQLSKIEPAQGVFDGGISLAANKNFSDLHLKLKVERALFAPAVQKLMTQGGGIGPISSSLDLSTKSRKVSDIKGSFKVANMNIEGIEMNSTQVKLNYLKSELLLDAKVGDLKMSAQSYPMQIVGEVFSSVAKSHPQGIVQVSNIAGQFQINEFKTFRWKNLNGILGKSGRVQTEGSWNEQDNLKGAVSIITGIPEHWKIEGTRTLPIFTPVYESNRK